MAKHVYASKSEVAYAELREKILIGDLEAGSRLSQYAIADELQISITPLREAIRRLHGEGLITLDAHRNARVAPMSRHEARELFETRRALDPLAVELAAVRRTAVDIERMQTALEQLLPVTSEWGSAGLSAHRELHTALYKASHNEVLIRMLDDIWDKSDRYRRAGLQIADDPDARRQDFEDHGRLVELVVSSAASQAGELMRAHIDQSVTARALEVWDSAPGE